MDLNELLSLHQIAAMKANAQDGAVDDRGHYAKVLLYAQRIGELRAMKHQAALGEKSRADTVIYGTYAGDPAPLCVPQTVPVTEWENEGGALVASPSLAAPKTS